jgi:chromate transporter
LPLGFVAFGGPQAHIAILRDALVDQRYWLDEEQFTELFAIGQGLPGPTSTQLVVSTALARAGPLGGLMAFMVWTLPGLVVLTKIKRTELKESVQNQECK